MKNQYVLFDGVVNRKDKMVNGTCRSSCGPLVCTVGQKMPIKKFRISPNEIVWLLCFSYELLKHISIYRSLRCFTSVGLA